MRRIDVHGEVGHPVHARRLGVAVVVDIIHMALQSAPSIRYQKKGDRDKHPQKYPSRPNAPLVPPTPSALPSRTPRCRPAAPATRLRWRAELALHRRSAVRCSQRPGTCRCGCVGQRSSARGAVRRGGVMMVLLLVGCGVVLRGRRAGGGGWWIDGGTRCRRGACRCPWQGVLLGGGGTALLVVVMAGRCEKGSIDGFVIHCKQGRSVTRSRLSDVYSKLPTAG